MSACDGDQDGNCGRAKPRAVEYQGAWHVAELHESGSRLAAHFPRRLGSLPARALLHAWAGTGMPRQVFERPVTARQAKVVSRRILVSTGRQRQERLVCCSDLSIVSTSNIMRSCFRPSARRLEIASDRNEGRPNDFCSHDELRRHP